MCLISKRIDLAVAHTQLYYRFRSGYQLFLIDRMVDLCGYINNKTTSKIIDMVLPTFKRYFTSNVTLACPYQGRFDLVRLPLTGGLLNNMFIPVGSYYVNITVFANKKKDLFWSGQFYFIIPEGTTIEDDRMGR